VLNEALEFFGLTTGSNARSSRYESGMAQSRIEQRELAEAMRRLPGRYADRLSARTREKITGAAAGGQWEKAIDDLMTALHARAETTTAAERDELRAVLDALKMPGEHLDALLVQADSPSYRPRAATSTRPPSGATRPIGRGMFLVLDLDAGPEPQTRHAMGGHAIVGSGLSPVWLPRSWDGQGAGGWVPEIGGWSSAWQLVPQARASGGSGWSASADPSRWLSHAAGRVGGASEVADAAAGR
jgi:hypothetical protein